ncbi:MAG: class I fructose-bisphosphate aldolase [Patescibacteria group bacterium]
MDKNKLAKIAKQLVAPGKGILAADESTGTMEKRLMAINVASTEENRKAYRKMMFSTQGVEKFISGVILYEETLRQDLGKILLDKGILIGIKVDQGMNESGVTEGLAGLPERLGEYIKLGVVFTKWRAVVVIGGKDNLEENATRLAEYAKICQEAGLVPIVEPEVLMDGEHTIEKCEEVTMQTLKIVFEKLKEKEVVLEGMLLKPSMVLSGKNCLAQASVQEVAEATVRCFKQFVPKEVAGAVFLSGGLSPDEATDRLRAINQMKDLPWQMSFSFGRALQQEALQAWVGKAENKVLAQKAFYKRAEKVSLARQNK